MSAQNKWVMRHTAISATCLHPVRPSVGLPSARLSLSIYGPSDHICQACVDQIYTVDLCLECTHIVHDVRFHSGMLHRNPIQIF